MKKVTKSLMVVSSVGVLAVAGLALYVAMIPFIESKKAELDALKSSMSGINTEDEDFFD